MSSEETRESEALGRVKKFGPMYSRGRKSKIAGIHIKNFKSVQEADIELRDLTVVVGANSSGKSTLIQSLVALKQAMLAAHDTRSFEFNGEYQSLGVFEDVVNDQDNKEKREKKITLGVKVNTIETLMCDVDSQVALTYEEEIVPGFSGESKRSTVPVSVDIDWTNVLSNEGPNNDQPEICETHLEVLATQDFSLREYEPHHFGPWLAALHAELDLSFPFSYGTTSAKKVEREIKNRRGPDVYFLSGAGNSSIRKTEKTKDGMIRGAVKPQLSDEGVFDTFPDFMDDDDHFWYDEVSGLGLQNLLPSYIMGRREFAPYLSDLYLSIFTSHILERLMEELAHRRRPASASDSEAIDLSLEGVEGIVEGGTTPPSIDLESALKAASESERFELVRLVLSSRTAIWNDDALDFAYNTITDVFTNDSPVAEILNRRVGGKSVSEVVEFVTDFFSKALMEYFDHYFDYEDYSTDHEKILRSNFNMDYGKGEQNLTHFDHAFRSSLRGEYSSGDDDVIDLEWLLIIFMCIVGIYQFAEVLEAPDEIDAINGPHTRLGHFSAFLNREIMENISSQLYQISGDYTVSASSIADHVYIPIPIESHLRNSGVIFDKSCRSLQQMFINKMKYLGPIRQEPREFAPFQTYSTSLGVRGENLASILHYHGQREGDYLLPGQNIEANRTDFARLIEKAQGHTLEGAIGLWLKWFGIGKEIASEDIGLGRRLQVTAPDREVGSSLTSVGVGVSQVLPVIVQCLLSDSDDILLFEQPELHLHPALQKRLGEFLVFMMRNGRQIIVETHSEHLVNQIRTTVAEDEENELAESIQLIFAEKVDGSTEYRTSDLNNYGGLDEDWPDGFLDISSKTSAELIQAAVEKRKRELDDDSQNEQGKKKK